MRRRLLAVFFLFMISCTVISRIYDSVTVPKVVTAAAKRKTVETKVEGTGTVKVKGKRFCSVVPGLRVRKIEVIPGSEVKAEEPLFWYDGESLEEKRREIQEELDRIALDIEKEQISQETVRAMTQEETAQWELALALRELEAGRRELEETREAHRAELERLEEAYVQGMDLAEDELWQQQERDREAARLDLESSKSSRDEAVREQERKIEDLEEELEGLTGEDEGKRASLEKGLARAREDLEDLTDTWEERVDRADNQLSLLDYQEDRIRYGQTSIQESRRETYEAAIRQEQERMKAAEKQVEELGKAVEKAQWQLSAAQRQDETSQQTERRQRRISALTVKGLELDKREWERQLTVIDALLESGGQMKAPLDGVVVDMELTEGKTASGQELVSLSVGETLFEGTFLKEEQELTTGDRLQILVPGTRQTREAVISRLNLMGDTEGVFQADLDQGGLDLGVITSYSCSRQSDMFDKVIPLEGLRKDMKGYYCLVARSRTTMLGEEFRAERVEVQVLYQGAREAAVEASIFESDAVIIGENKTISAGVRVRPVSGF